MDHDVNMLSMKMFSQLRLAAFHAAFHELAGHRQVSADRIPKTEQAGGFENIPDLAVDPLDTAFCISNDDPVIH